MKKKQKNVVKPLKHFKNNGRILKNNNNSRPEIYKKEINHAGEVVSEEKMFVVKYDPYHCQGSYIEKMAYDLFSLLGVTVPKSYIIDNTAIASRMLPGYQDLSDYIFTESINTKTRKSEKILDQKKYNEISERGTLNGKPIRGFAEFNAIYYFCFDTDLIGHHFGNMGLIEYADYYQAVKIDPSILLKMKRFLSLPSFPYEHVLGYFFNFKYFNNLFKSVLPEQNILAFEKIINIRDDELNEIVFNPAFFNSETKEELRIPPIQSTIEEDTFQKQLLVSLKHRRDIFKEVYAHFFPLYQAISENSSLENRFEKLLKASEQSRLPLLKAATYSGDLELIAYCIDHFPDQLYFNEKENLLELAYKLEFIQLVEYLHEKKNDVFVLLNKNLSTISEASGSKSLLDLKTQVKPRKPLKLPQGHLNNKQKKEETPSIENTESTEPLVNINPSKKELNAHEDPAVISDVNKFNEAWIPIIHNAMNQAIFKMGSILAGGKSQKEEVLKKLMIKCITIMKNPKNTDQEIQAALINFWKVLATPRKGGVNFFPAEYGQTHSAIAFNNNINQQSDENLKSYMKKITSNISQAFDQRNMLTRGT